jgi:hypothetical protein
MGSDAGGVCCYAVVFFGKQSYSKTVIQAVGSWDPGMPTSDFLNDCFIVCLACQDYPGLPILFNHLLQLRQQFFTPQILGNDPALRIQEKVLGDRFYTI